MSVNVLRRLGYHGSLTARLVQTAEASTGLFEDSGEVLFEATALIETSSIANIQILNHTLLLIVPIPRLESDSNSTWKVAQSTQ